MAKIAALTLRGFECKMIPRMKRRYPILANFIVICAVWLLRADPAIAADARNTPVVKVVREWSSSVVNISTERTVLLQQNPNWRQFGNFFDEFYKSYLLNAPGTMKLTSVGSGVIVSQDGLIITNAHVVNMASKVYVILSDGTTREAALVAINLRNDLALLKIAAAGILKPMRLAKDVMVGETVVSIGNPFGLDHSVTVGVVSGLNRNVTETATGRVIFDNLIQTDASINLGSSGGALINLDGDLVGINLAVIQGAQSLGFAVVYDKIRGILDDYYNFLKQQNTK